jgi:hypothetical protein
MANYKYTPEENAERQRRIVAMRRTRMPFDAIGADLGISASRAHQLYWEAMREIPNQDVTQHREEQRDLADKAISALLAIAEDPDVSPRTRVEAWSSVRGWCEHQAKLLALYAPVRKEVTVLTEDAVDAALRKLEEEHAEKARQLAALDQRAEAALVELGAEV